MITYDTEAINHLIQNRRTLYPIQYDTERQVPRSIVEQMLENANWAPSHGLTEPWRFRVYSGARTMELAQWMAEKYKELSPEDSFKQPKYDKMLRRGEQASHIIVLMMKRDPKGKIPEIEEIEATACAVQNMALTAFSHGVGVFWSSGGVTYREEAKPYFGLEQDDKLLGFMYVGYPKGDFPPGRRKPITDKVEWVE